MILLKSNIQTRIDTERDFMTFKGYGGYSANIPLYEGYCVEFDVCWGELCHQWSTRVAYKESTKLVLDLAFKKYLYANFIDCKRESVVYTDWFSK